MFRSSIAPGVLLLSSILVAGRATADDTFQVEVNILKAPIKSGSDPIGEAHRGDKLTAHEFNGSFYLVDLPGASPSQQGWIAKDDVHRVEDLLAEVKRRIAAVPADQRQQAVADFKQSFARIVELGKQYSTLDAKHQWTESLPIAKEIAERTEQLFGDHASITADKFNTLGNRLEDLGDYPAARKYLEQALAIRREVLGEKHADTAASLNNLGNVAWDMGDYPAARKYFEQALAINREVRGEKHADTAGSLNNLGVVARDMGDYPAARKYLEHALAIRREVLDEKHADTAASLNNLGAVAEAMGDYPAARKYFEQALAIRREVLGEKHADTAMSLNNLGVVARAMGDYPAARKYHEQALAIQREVRGEKHADTAASLNNLGLVARAMGDYPAARKYFEQALAIQREVLGEKHADTAASLHHLGVVAMDMGDYPAARKYHEQAIAIRREVLGEKHADTAASLNSLGIVAGNMGDCPAARKYFEQALAIKREVLGEDHPDTANSLINLSLTDAADGQWPAAADDMQQARQIARRHIARVLPALSAKEQLTFLDNTDRKDFHEGLSLGLARRSDGRIVAASAAWLVNGKAVADEALAENNRLAAEATEPAAREALEKLKAVRGQLAAMSMKVPPAKQREIWRKQIADLESQEQELARTLAGLGAKIETGDPWLSLNDLRGKLSADGLLVDIARFNLANFKAKGKEKHWFGDHYAAWLIPPAGKGEIQIVDLGDAEKIDAAVKAARSAIQQTGDPQKIRDIGEAEAEKQASAALRNLAERILDPIIAKTGDAKRLILSPDGALWLVPFAALPMSDGRYAIEKYRIDYVVSGRELVTGQADSRKVGEPLVFADPDYDLEPQAALVETQALLNGSESPSSRTQLASAARPPVDAVAMDMPAMRSVDSSGDFHAQRLTNTAYEAEHIAPSLKHYAGEAPHVYMQRQALEGVFKAAKGPRVLVLSTHGFFLPDQEVKQDDRKSAGDDHRGAAITTMKGKPLENPLLRCGLLLAGCNRRSEATTDDDGVLTGLEIVGTDLRGTELVVLSACETGLGDVHNGQGVAGLRQAFQLAGAQAVVSTLWSINDAASSRLMDQFFKNLSAGQSKGEALRNAQLAMIASRRAKFGAAHPLFWAAYTLTGQ